MEFGGSHRGRCGPPPLRDPSSILRSGSATDDGHEGRGKHRGRGKGKGLNGGRAVRVPHGPEGNRRGGLPYGEKKEGFKESGQHGSWGLSWRMQRGRKGRGKPFVAQPLISSEAVEKLLFVSHSGEPA